MLAILGQVVGLGTPETLVSPACNCSVDEECVDVAQVVDVYVVPNGSSRSDDWALLQAERYVGEFVDLAASLGAGSAASTWCVRVSGLVVVFGGCVGDLP